MIVTVIRDPRIRNILVILEGFVRTVISVRLVGHLKTWPILEQGTISKEPPHIQSLKDNSRFSPPQTSSPGSYSPSS
jgi:hypothetical protein